MSRLETTLQNLPTVAKYLMVLGVVLFISTLFPNNTRFKYEFTKGQTWNYDDLRAPFDFAVKKMPEEIQLEQDEIAKDFSPYYEMNLEMAKEKKAAFKKAFDQQLEEVKRDGAFRDVPARPRIYLDYTFNFIDRVYREGVAQLLPQHQEKGKEFVVNIIKGNTTQKQTLENLQIQSKVEDKVADVLFQSGLREADFLIPLMKGFFTPNVFYSDTLTKQFQQEQLSSISFSRGMVTKDSLIISKNGIVTDDIYQQLISFRDQYEVEISDKKHSWGVFAGFFLLTTLLIGLFLFYLQYHEQHIFERFTRLVFMMLWIVIFSYLVYIIESKNILSTYMIPFCIVPLVLRIFFGEQLALFTHIVIVLVASFLSSLGYEFTFLQLLAGIVAVLTPFDGRDWSKFFFSLLAIFLAYAIGNLGLSLIKDGQIASIDTSTFGYLVISVFLCLLAFPLIPLSERLFGFTSSVTLVELSDMNKPLLKELSMKAPGTLQHSLQVANLSEAAATQIGANALLVKVAALYHDIGKLKQPKFYIENQSGTNPHDEIDDMESAKIIIEHVTEGIVMAKKNRLPKLIIDFIRTHHGTTRTEYFYRNYTNKYPEREVDESVFRYPGPNPRTKEETILMIADSLEAACKSLKDPTEKELNDLIDKVLAGKIAQGQLVDSELTFSELEICITEFKKMLKSINHVRIEYPEEKKAAE